MVDLAAHIVAIGGSNPPKDSPLYQLSIDVRVWGSGSTWRGEFLSPAAGLKNGSHICDHTWNAVKIKVSF